MSQLQLSNSRWGTKMLNVMSFSSPITGMIDSAQTRTLVHHFPLKALQPELQLEVIFRGEREYEDFQLWVRNVQIDAQNNQVSPGVTIYWPQRSIYNWTGIIKNFEGGGKRANYTPRAKFIIDLVDSLVATRTSLSSLGTNFEEIYGVNTPGGILGAGRTRLPEDTLLSEPAPIQDNVSTGGEVKNQLNNIPTPVPSIGGSGGGGGSW